ncbi:restriction endonuclease [Streptomyces griseus]|uniref:restriction endonuclease n=1 Tax=Streptomyces griseus TaxID=1911 RepID=UPI00099C9431|nr:restriction endonuclease [Streptomyces griseus]
MVRTARSTGSYLPVVLAALALLLGVGAVMSGRRRTTATRLRYRYRDRDRDRDRDQDRREWNGQEENDVAGITHTIPLPDAGGHGTEALTAPLAAPPAVDSGALDHEGVDPDGFEHTIAALCARDGCSPVEVVGGAGDLGADVIATTPAGMRVVLQCKQYGEDHRVGSPDLQRFGGTCYAVHDADVAVLVTTSSFTDPALEYAAACGIVCVDGTELAAWTASTAPPPWAARAGDPAPGPGDESPCATA